MKPTANRRFFSLLPLLLLSGVAWAADAAEVRARAYELYDLGSYAEALPLLTKLVEEGAGDGPMLYRLYFSQQATGDASARETLRRALGALEEELPDTSDLEVPFYLGTIYSGVGRLTDRTRVAAEATARIEAGSLRVPETGVSYFRVGKLYADQERVDEVAKWYAKALEKLGGEGTTGRAYSAIAARYLADAAVAGGDLNTAVGYYAMLPKEALTVQDLDRLAVASVRAGEYEAARAAWQQAVLLNPAQGNRPRYCAALANQAKEFDGLPAGAPDGRVWGELNRAELEELMLSQVSQASAVMDRARDNDSLDADERATMTAEVEGFRRVFVAAALEYALRNLPLRETAFQAGYAPLIFHRSRWQLPY
jgi:tetratricopeptide (TPR) repeat protein